MQPAEAFYLWWSRQPEVIAADEQREAQKSQLAWKIRKMENKVERQEEKLLRSGFSDREISRLKRLAGVRKDDITRGLAMGH